VLLARSHIHVPQPGVYALFKGIYPIWVGKTVNLATRLYHHLEYEGREFDMVWFYPLPKQQLNSVEAELMAHVRPTENLRRSTQLPSGEWYIQ